MNASKTAHSRVLGAMILLTFALTLLLPAAALAAPPVKAKMLLFAYTVPNYEKTAAFYKEALGVEFPKQTFSVKAIQVGKAGLSKGSAHVELLQMEKWLGNKPGYGSGHIGFLVEDIDAMHKHVASLGHSPSGIIFPITGNKKVRIFFFRGPNDEKLEIVEIKK